MAIMQSIQADGGLPAGDVLHRMDGLLDKVTTDRHSLDPRTRLAWAKLARRVASRVDALASVLLAEADQADAARKAVGTPTSSWLADGQRSKGEAAGLLHRARDLGGHALVGQAAVEGQVTSGQARSITKLLDGLAPQLDQTQRARAEELLLTMAARCDADQLAKAAPQVLAQVAPADADELLETRLQREAEAAHQQRSLRFFREAGSVRFTGSLPRVDAELWIAQLDLHSEKQRRTAIEERDPLATTITPEQRKADALINLIHAASQGNGTGEPGAGGARVLVTLDYAALQAGAAGAGLVGEEPLSAGQLRQLCCDAELVPLVLGGPSEVLDVGRAHRLVTPPIRAALIVRDGGCVFPGCTTPVTQSDAHHVIPWWAGGDTSLSNLVLLCHHHHGLVEPARHTVRDQWQVRIASDGLPEFLPPRRYDPDQKPIRHYRHTTTKPPRPPETPQAANQHAARRSGHTAGTAGNPTGEPPTGVLGASPE